MFFFRLITSSFFISTAVCMMVIYFSKSSGFCIDHVDNDKPQGFHVTPTSRGGGVGIFLAFFSGCWLLAGRHWSVSQLLFLRIFDYLVILSLLIFSVGFFEDIRSNIKPSLRLTIIAFVALLGIFLLDGTIFNVGILKLPFWVAVPFTILAVTGVTNSINIIDGFNGLASGVAMLVLFFFSLSAYIHKDLLVLNLSLILFFSIAGFFIWNFPQGKIFLGDGGAYFIGFLLAELSVLLVKRDADISPWFPLVILAYPIFEVLFSIYRRKFEGDGSAFNPDGAHLHTLIYKRITRSNAKTSVYIWLIAGSIMPFAFLFRYNTDILILFFILYSFCYVYLYKRIDGQGAPECQDKN